MENRERRHTVGEMYHIYSRGVDKRTIFLQETDYVRFIHDLFEFNNKEKSYNVSYYLNRGQKVSLNQARKPRKMEIEILAFALMPNHYHLLLRPRGENSISNFMKKLGVGYSRYFNGKYKRTGALFEGRYKYVHVENEQHFVHLPYYIHANPLKLKFPKWRDGLAAGDVPRAMEFLKKYRWSSFPDYIGHKNFPSVTNRKFLWGMQKGRTDEERAKSYLKDFTSWLKDFDVSSLPEEVVH